MREPLFLFQEGVVGCWWVEGRKKVVRGMQERGRGEHRGSKRGEIQPSLCPQVLHGGGQYPLLLLPRHEAVFFFSS